MAIVVKDRVKQNANAPGTPYCYHVLRSNNANQQVRYLEQ